MNYKITHAVIGRLYRVTDGFLGLLGVKEDSKLARAVQSPIDMALNYVLSKRSRPNLSREKIRSMSCDELLALGYNEEELIYLKPDEPDFLDIAAMSCSDSGSGRYVESDTKGFNWVDYSINGTNHGELI